MVWKTLRALQPRGVAWQQLPLAVAQAACDDWIHVQTWGLGNTARIVPAVAAKQGAAQWLRMRDQALMRVPVRDVVPCSYI